jgi:hypothetical protein
LIATVVSHHFARNLAPAWARQDHTTSPSAKPAARRSAPFASTAFRSTFVTTRTPLLKVAERPKYISVFPKLQDCGPWTNWHDGQFASGWYATMNVQRTSFPTPNIPLARGRHRQTKRCLWKPSKHDRQDLGIVSRAVLIFHIDRARHKREFDGGNDVGRLHDSQFS